MLSGVWTVLALWKILVKEHGADTLPSVLIDSSWARKSDEPIQQPGLHVLFEG